MKKKPLKTQGIILPDGFSLKYELVYQDSPITSLAADEFDLNNIENFNEYKHELYVPNNVVGINKTYANLPFNPVGYFFSVLVFKVTSNEDSEKWYELYPDKRGNLDCFECYSEEYGYKVWNNRWESEIQKSINKYFNAKKYKKPVPVLIKYARCGFYVDDSCLQEEIDERVTLNNDLFSDKLRNGKTKVAICEHGLPWFQHCPYCDSNYHKIWMNSPLRINDDIHMFAYLMRLVSKVNFFAQSKLLDLDDLVEVWDILTYLNYTSRFQNKIYTDYIKSRVNPFIEQCQNVTSPQNDLILKTFTGYLDELHKNGHAKKCPKCSKAFWDKKRTYCSEACRRSINRKKDYLKNIEQRRKSARKANKALREFYKEKGVKK